MNKTIRCIIIILLAVSFAISPLAEVLAQNTSSAHLAPLSIGKGTIIPNQYIVVLKSVASQEIQASAISTLEASGGKVIFQYDAALNGFAAVLPDKALLELRQNPQVDYIEADQVVTLEPDPNMDETAPAEIIENDTVQTETLQTGATWGLDRVDQRALPLNGTYTYLNTGAGVNVYLIDSGIRTTHTQFGGRATKDFDAIGDGQNGNDCDGHGTHVAATIGGSTYGVAKSVKLHAVRVFGCDGRGSWATVIAGVNWVAANHIKPAVANMSLVGWYDASVNAAVDAAIAKGVTFVIAAGNAYADACNYSPASTTAAITVGASEANDGRAAYSNWGTCLDLFAPGSNVTSAGFTSDTAIATHSGTSMATPHVVGAAALYLSSDPTLTPAQVASGLINFSTTNMILDPNGSVNRLLYSQVVAPLVVPTPIAPSGSIDDYTPTYSWTKISGATHYRYQLYHGTTLVYSQTILASACGTTTYCVSTPTTALASATSYAWQVRAYVSNVWKTLSAAKTFIIEPITIPTLVTPIDTITDTTPAFSWTKIIGATQYEYELYQDTTLISTQTVLAADCGAAANCVNTPANVLPFAAYTWRAHALVKGIWKDFSAPQAFTVAPITVSTPLTPNSSINTMNPTYTWAMVSDATEYELQLYKGTTLIYTQSILAADCGAAENCVITPTTALPRAAYTWQVRALIAGVWNAFSTHQAFTVNLPSVPTLITPSSTITDITPTYTWTKVAWATHYQYQLYRGTTLVYTQAISASACGDTNCVHTPTTALPRASYTWKVRALIDNVWNAFSAARAMTVNPPSIPTSITPINSITDITPTYTWTKIAWASKYQYQLYKGTTLVYTKIISASACGTTNCVNTPTTALRGAAYTWKVRAFVDGTWRAFNSARAFNVNPLTISTLIKPLGTIADHTPTYSWTKIAWATQYQYQLYRGTTLVYTKIVLANACGTTVNCVNTPPTSLNRSTYTWKVRAMVGGIWKTFSAPRAFTVNPPTIPTLGRPSGSITDNTPTFVWSRIFGATRYQYQLYKGTTLVYTKTILPGACGTSTSCVNTPAKVLSRTAYSWKVRAMIGDIWQPFSATRTFSIVAPPTIPTIVKPLGSITDTTPTFSWSKISGATRYQYQLYRGTNLIYTQTVLSSACGATTNCVNTPTTVLAHAAYTWRVRAMVGGVWRTFSAARTFTIP